jgi:hypothetical protein
LLPQYGKVGGEAGHRCLRKRRKVGFTFIPPIGQRPLGIDIDKDNRPRACQLRLNRQMAGQGRFARPALL